MTDLFAILIRRMNEQAQAVTAADFEDDDDSTTYVAPDRQQARDHRCASLRRMLPEEDDELRARLGASDDRAAAKRLSRDLKRIGARRVDGVWQLARKAA